MKQVDIYTTKTCPYCRRAKALLDTKNVPYTEIDVTDNAPLREKMTVRAAGRRTVPQIFIGSLHIGGCDDLHALEDAGKLDILLAD